MARLGCLLSMLPLLSICSASSLGAWNDAWEDADECCIQKQKILHCSYRSSAKKFELDMNHWNGIDQVFIDDFPEISIKGSNFNSLNVKNSNVAIRDPGSWKDATGQLQLHHSAINVVPAAVSHINAYNSSVNGIYLTKLKFVQIVKSRMKILGNGDLSFADVTIVESAVEVESRIMITESSSMKFSKCTISPLYYLSFKIVLFGELTLETTKLKAESIEVHPGAIFQLISPVDTSVVVDQVHYSLLTSGKNNTFPHQQLNHTVCSVATTVNSSVKVLWPVGLLIISSLLVKGHT